MTQETKGNLVIAFLAEIKYNLMLIKDEKKKKVIKEELAELIEDIDWLLAEVVEE